MRLVNIKYVEEGSVLARTIRNATGNTLLVEGAVLSRGYIAKLESLGIDMLFIKDERFKDIEFNPVISDKTRESAYKTIRGVINSFEAGDSVSLDAESIKSAVSNIINDLLYSYDVVNNLADIMGYDEYTFQHSVNTTVLALILGLGKGYTHAKLLELGMGVLMHDIGKVNLPKEILNKPGNLSTEEFAEVKKHPSLGFDVIRKNQDFSINSAHVALQHHERWTGGGYPRGLKGKEIHEFGRITAVADVYDALISKRPYRQAQEPYQAYEYIHSQAGHHFDPDIVRIFTKRVAVYPLGTGVRLSNGWRGNVIRQNKDKPDRPVIRVIYEGEEPLEQPIDIDLARTLNLMIEKVENK